MMFYEMNSLARDRFWHYMQPQGQLWLARCDSEVFQLLCFAVFLVAYLFQTFWHWLGYFMDVIFYGWQRLVDKIYVADKVYMVFGDVQCLGAVSFCMQLE